MENTNMAAHGCLLIHDLTAGQKQMESLCHSLEEAGYPTGAPNLFGYPPRDQFDRTPMWQRWLTQAQEAYVELRRICEKVTVLGVGNGGAIATVLAEQYSVDGLIVVGSVFRMNRFADAVRRQLPFVPLPGAGKAVTGWNVSKLVRLAQNNLFSIVSNVLVIETMGEETYSPRGGDILLSGVRSKEKQRMELEAATVRDVCRTHAPQLRQAVLDFLDSVE